MKIVLLGYMGSGKSTVGQVLAKNLGLQFHDLDALIEAQEGKTIPQIFDQKGELYFRKLEYRVLEEMLNSPADFILALGGGTPCYGNNMSAILKATPAVFYIQLPIPALSKRLLPEKAERPLISHIPDEELPEFIGKHLFERVPFYSRAHHTLKAENKSPEELAEEIEGFLV
ncbi:MAG: shikimate kinase [Eudoraea sp.]|nr:shikimate kinase [Eudoraea sp.]